MKGSKAKPQKTSGEKRSKEQGNNQYFFPTDWGLTSVLYRADLAPEYVDNESWGLLWDPKYKGRLSMADSLIDGVMVAAIYIGAKDPFNMTDDEMAKTRAALKEQLPLMRYYWTSPADIEQALASGELVATSAWNSSYAALKKEGLDVRYTSPKEGAMEEKRGLSSTAPTPRPLDGWS